MTSKPTNVSGLDAVVSGSSWAQHVVGCPSNTDAATKNCRQISDALVGKGASSRRFLLQCNIRECLHRETHMILHLETRPGLLYACLR